MKKLNRKSLVVVSCVMLSGLAGATTHTAANEEELAAAIGLLAANDEIVLTGSKYDMSKLTPTTVSITKYDTTASGASYVWLNAIDGVTIRSASGKAADCVWVADPNTSARAVSSYNVSFALKGITFRGFSFTGVGGAVYAGHPANTTVINGSRVEVLNCTFDSCSAAKTAGALRMPPARYESANSRITTSVVRGCIFTNCTAVSSSGASSGSIYYDCQFFCNKVTEGKNGTLEAHASDVVPLTCSNCLFFANQACGTGSQCYRGVGAIAYAYDSKFINNSAAKAYGAVGGGSFYRCVFSGNSDNGGGSLIGQGAILYSCIVTNHESSAAGGLGVGNCYNSIFAFNKLTHKTGSNMCGGSLINCTVVSNRFVSAVGKDTVHTNSLFYGNIGVNGKANADFYAQRVTVVNCLFGTCENGSTWPFTEISCWSNVEHPPKFVGSGAHPFALAKRSFGIDLGVMIPEQSEKDNPISRDRAGNPRVMGKAVDLGCYEYRPQGLMLLLK